jgi:hypothetical protein
VLAPRRIQIALRRDVPESDGHRARALLLANAGPVEIVWERGPRDDDPSGGQVVGEPPGLDDDTRVRVAIDRAPTLLSLGVRPRLLQEYAVSDQSGKRFTPPQHRAYRIASGTSSNWNNTQCFSAF